MFVGHYSVAFAAKSERNKIPLWVLFIAVQFLDYIWATLVLLGIEKLRVIKGFTAGSSPTLISIRTRIAGSWRSRGRRLLLLFTAKRCAVIMIIFGLSGAEKTTMGKLLTRKLDWHFPKADDFHSQQMSRRCAVVMLSRTKTGGRGYRR